MSRRRRVLVSLVTALTLVACLGFAQAVSATREGKVPVAFATTPSGKGYWVAYANGGVRGFGNARPLGGADRYHLHAPIVGMASTRSGRGYWLVAADGGVFSFGDATFRGSLGALRLSQPIVGIARTPSARGYWLVASDGGVFSFGDARFHGSTALLRLHAPIAGMAATRSGRGYWLVGADGGVFTFGDARFMGSAAKRAVTAKITGITAARDGRAYWMTTADAHVFGFGKVPYAAASSRRAHPQIVGLATDGGRWHVLGSNGRAVRYREWGSHRASDEPTTTTTNHAPGDPPTTEPPTTEPPTTAPPVTDPPTTSPTTTPPSTTPPTTPPTDPPPTRISSNITDYVKLAGDQVVTVPDGTYRAGVVNAPHNATNGAYRGWLVLKSQSLHGAVIDLRGQAFELGDRTTRVAFVGFKFVNGSVKVYGQDISFWYTDHSFPAREWLAQATDKQRPENGYYRAPRTLYADSSTTQRVSFYGTDIHDTASGILISKSKNLLIQGAHFWNLSDEGLDPQDVVHPDAIGGVAGQSQNFTVRDTWVQGRIMMIDANGSGTTGGPHQNFLFSNDWVSNSPSGGFTFTSRKDAPPWGIFGTRQDVRSWGHNNGLDRLEIIGGRQIRQPNTQPSRINVIDSGIVTSAPANLNASPPAGWRAAHPYSSWGEAL